MTIDEIANYCEIMDCQVTVGGPDLGFVRIDGTGVRRSGNYNRFHSLNEMAAAPSPGRVVDKASLVRIHQSRGERVLSPAEFQAEYDKILSRIEE